MVCRTRDRVCGPSEDVTRAALETMCIVVEPGREVRSVLGFSFNPRLGHRLYQAPRRRLRRGVLRSSEGTTAGKRARFGDPHEVNPSQGGSGGGRSPSTGRGLGGAEVSKPKLRASGERPTTESLLLRFRTPGVEVWGIRWSSRRCGFGVWVSFLVVRFSGSG